jgi:hypothetical protein
MFIICRELNSQGFCLKISGFNINHGSALLTTGFSTAGKGFFYARFFYYSAMSSVKQTSENRSHQREDSPVHVP